MHRVTLPLTLFVLSTGCAPESGSSYEPGFVDDAAVSLDADGALDTMSPQTRPVLDGQIIGTMPGYGELDRRVTEGTFRRTRNYVDVEFHSTTDDWSLVVGSLYVPDLEPGVPVEVQLGRGELMGCAGPEFETYDFYDESATSVTITEQIVDTEGEPLMEYTVVARFGNGGEIASKVVVPLPDDA